MTGAQQTIPYLLVLGYQLRSDGHMNSVLRARLNRCIARYRTHEQGRRADAMPLTIIVSGGKCAGATNPTEAQVMKHYLIQHGIPSAAIYSEARSHNTHENVRNALTILLRRHMLVPTPKRTLATICIVTSYWHLPRVQQVLRKLQKARSQIVWRAAPSQQAQPLLLQFSFAWPKNTKTNKNKRTAASLRRTMRGCIAMTRPPQER